MFVSFLSSYSLQCCNLNNCNYQSTSSTSNNNQVSSGVTSCYYGSIISGSIPNFLPYTPTQQSCSSIASTDSSGSDNCAVNDFTLKKLIQKYFLLNFKS